MNRNRTSFLVFSLILLICCLVTPVSARRSVQSADDAPIRQVLQATADELGWNTKVKYTINFDGNPFWSISPSETSMEISHIVIEDFTSSSTASQRFNQAISAMRSVYGNAERYTFHTYSAFSTSLGGEHRLIGLLVGQYFVEIYGSPASATSNILDVFYHHAVQYGFMQSDQPESTPTAEVEPTPQPAMDIRLTASADGYSPLAQVIDNSMNYNTISITGRVTDRVTGAPIGGALIEITSGATPILTYAAADGSYTLIAVVTGGQDSGQVSGLDFALETTADLTINVISESIELAADGTSTSRVIIQVKDQSGNPIAGREISLSLTGDIGPGTIRPVQGISDENGLLEATYTAFKLEPGPPLSTTRHEVTITAQDQITGLTGSDTIFVSQHSLAIIHEEFLPACSNCDLPASFSIQLSDYWLNPVANAPLSIRVEGGEGGFLSTSTNPNSLSQEINITTDANGRASFFFKWQGMLTGPEAVRSVVILEELTNAQETRNVKVQGLDIAIARVEEAGFTGYTGHQAFFKIYFKERAYPDLPIDRFNTLSPNKLGLRVSISQFHSDGENTSLTFENTGHWMTDEGGSYVKMYTTPFMPYIIPVNDGTSWYEVRLDPVIDDDTGLPDLFRANNSTIIALTTGSPEGWLHIWLKEGVLTPTSYVGVAVKCVARILPGLGDALTVIDTLNQVYNSDLLGLSQSTAQVLTETLQKRVEQVSSSLLTKVKASTLNNLVSCIQDAYGVHKQSTVGNLPYLGACAHHASLVPLPRAVEPSLDPPPFPQLLLDQFVHGMLLDDPNQKAVILYGVDAANLQIFDNQQRNLGLPDTLSHEHGVVVFLFQANESYTLQFETRSPFEAALYAASVDGERETLRFNVDLEMPSQSLLNITSSSDPVLTIDLDNDGLPEHVLAPERTRHDILKPIITKTSPADGQVLRISNINITAAYMDEPGGSGIDTASVRIWLDDIDMASEAVLDTQQITLPISDLLPGSHQARLEVRDMHGNLSFFEWGFSITEPNLLTNINIPPGLLFTAGGGFILLTVCLAITLIILSRNKGRQKSPIFTAPPPTPEELLLQDKPKETTSLSEGQPLPGRPAEPSPPQYPYQPVRSPQAEKKRTRLVSCLLTLLMSALMMVLSFGAVSLIAFQFFPGVSIPPGSGVTIQSLVIWFGGGAFAALLGGLFLLAGIRAILNQWVVSKAHSGNQHQPHGCVAFIPMLLLAIFGLTLLVGSFLLASFTIYQQLLPYLGF